MVYKHKETGNTIEFHTDEFEVMLKRQGFEVVTEAQPVIEVIAEALTEEVIVEVKPTRTYGRPKKK